MAQPPQPQVALHPDKGPRGTTMKKLLAGILNFRKNTAAEYRARFAHLARFQSPDCLMVACSDSRVVPNVFASTEPGDLFVMRNVGNIVPPADFGPNAAAAGIDFSLRKLSVRDAVVCGHSHCGAMGAILNYELDSPALANWLANGLPSRARMMKGIFDPHLSPQDQLGQANVLQQLAHMLTYPHVDDAVRSGRLRLHAWWFDLENAEVLGWSQADGRFLPITSLEESGLVDPETLRPSREAPATGIGPA